MPKPAPEILTPLIVKSDVAPFDTLTVCVFVVPTTTFPNPIGEGLTATVAPAAEGPATFDLPVIPMQPADPSNARKATTVARPRTPNGLELPQRDISALSFCRMDAPPNEIRLSSGGVVRDYWTKVHTSDRWELCTDGQSFGSPAGRCRPALRFYLQFSLAAFALPKKHARERYGIAAIA
jgi:hypothetical protein